MQRKREKPYHLDYCFLSRDLLERVTDVRVGEYEDWIGLSDHMPLIVDLG
jgi:endonuclease/exonuclease/phosphatase family metal-dependent hydrolase